MTMSLTNAETLALHLHANVLARKLAVRLDATGMNLQELMVLALIDANPGVLPTEVAAIQGSATPTVSHVLSRLDAAGLITRTVSSRDKRARVLALTAAGRTALAHALAHVPPLTGAAFGPQLLAKVRNAAERA
jgi:DNA-binding MarR family transcriptional regulator